jgi:hypothetical protein
MINACRVLIGKLEEKGLLGRRRRRRVSSIEMDLKGMSGRWMDLNRYQWQAV